jgi:hypothetical protein
MIWIMGIASLSLKICESGEVELAGADGVSASKWETLYEERSQWWSFQTLSNPEVPEIMQKGGAIDGIDPIDRFILEKLEANGLEPASRARRTTLVRRLAFALTGLPPRASLIDDFLANRSPEAWERVVDRMLVSPHFGERWARHWMDVVRYAETYGYEWDIWAKGAWRYRDYLIRAFNQDVPFDQLVREHIAGDLLERPRIDRDLGINESLIGPMFFQMGEKRHDDSLSFNGARQDMVDDQIDAFSKAFQGLTMSCARCHDHKLDPVSQREYYALAGVFMSSRWATNTVDLPERNASEIAELKRIKAELQPLLAERFIREFEGFPDDLVALDAEGQYPQMKRLLEARAKTAPTLEDPLYPWIEIVAALGAGKSVAAAWRDMAKKYAAESRRRRKDNEENLRIVADFRRGIPDGWSVDGVGLRDIVPCGDFTVALTGEKAVESLLPGGLFTNALSPRLNGVVRSPFLRAFEKPKISFEITGGGDASHRTVFDNEFLTEHQNFLERDALGWMWLHTRHTLKDRRINIEIATKTSNPNYPPRDGKCSGCTPERIADPNSWFGLTRVAIHDKDFTPHDSLSRFSGLFESNDPKTLQELARRYDEWFGAALNAWREDRSTEDDVALINWLLAGGLLSNRYADANATDDRIGNLVMQYRKTEERLEIPWTVNGMADHDPGFDCRLDIRGNYNDPGAQVPRGYPRLLAGLQNESKSDGSGRRELAELIANPANPLTARVFVNRVWHWLFGTGIVATPSNFGHLGQLPSHPKLLDYLAQRFMREGWSLKQLIRQIVGTQAWRQDGHTTESALALDPDNRLLSYYPLRRLEAEAIRDSIIATSGRLDPRLYGRSVFPYRETETEANREKRLYRGPLDGDGRRSVYMRISIMEPPPFLAAFNQPDPKISVGRRDVTSTVEQSLALLNGPLAFQQAEQWARRLIEPQEDGDADPIQRLGRMFWEAFSRRPTAAETIRWRQAAEEFAHAHRVPNDDLMTSIEVWTAVAHAIYNTKEFIYVR